jgi:hypothetical protein
MFRIEEKICPSRESEIEHTIVRNKYFRDHLGLNCLHIHFRHYEQQLRGCSPQANYTDRATAACPRS